MVRRKTVLALLCVTVLAPLVLYTDRPSSADNSTVTGEYGEEVSNLSFGNEVRTLRALPQELADDVKEPIGMVYPGNSSSSGQILTAPKDEFSETTAEDVASDLPLTNSGEHKNRMLSAAVEERILPEGKMIEQVNERDIATDNSEKLKFVEQGMGLKFQQDTVTSPPNPKTEAVIEQVTEAEVRNDDSEELKSVEESMELNFQQATATPPPNPKKEDAKSNENGRTASSTNGQQKHHKLQSKISIIGAVIPDDKVRHLRDQLIRARVYQSLGVTRSNPHFIRELRLRVREVQRAVGDATRDSDLPRNADEKLRAMEETLAKGQRIQDDCASVVKKLRAMLHSTEDQLRVHKKQALFLTQIAAKTLPKGLHCLPLRLSTEYFSKISSEQPVLNLERLEDPNLYHYALFSDNILAAAVVVNSTVSNAKKPEDHVFHIVTDRLNYAAMKMWFIVNQPGKATVQVQNIEEFTWLNASYSPVLKQLGSKSMIDYYFRSHHANSDANLKFRNPKYLSILNHLRFYLPEIFPKLAKVVFLDDDIVVQKDLTGLWAIDMKTKVNGAVETCGTDFHRFHKYLNFSNSLIAKNFNPHACGWAYGMNIFDLAEWRKQNITEVYHYWQNMNADRQLWKLGSLPPGLITFYNRTYPLDSSWHVLGLGYNPNVSQKEVEAAAVIHYNGNFKPWLEIGFPKYRGYWSKYVNYDQDFLRDCNINPQ